MVAGTYLKQKDRILCQYVPSSVNILVHNVPITKKMNLKEYYELYSQFSHQYVSVGIAAIFKIVLLQDYKSTNVVSCVAVTALQLFVMEWRRQSLPHLYLCMVFISITLKMAAIAAETCWWKTVNKLHHKHWRVGFFVFMCYRVLSVILQYYKRNLKAIIPDRSKLVALAYERVGI